MPKHSGPEPRDPPSPWRSSWRDLIPVVESLVVPEIRFAVVEATHPTGVNPVTWPPNEVASRIGWAIPTFRGFGDGHGLWVLMRAGAGYGFAMGGISPLEQALDVFGRVALRRYHALENSLAAMVSWCALLLRESIKTQEFTVECAAENGRVVPVAVRIIVDGVAATLDMIARLATDEAPVSVRRPHYAERVRRVWQYLDSQSGRRTLDETATDLEMGKSTVHAAIETLRADRVVKDRPDGTMEVEPFD